jgi:glycine/D-amino acid oxidase-like deaminating enzyme/nitrite reductase/ring-hydroxylating ferredoxin subunit
MGAGVAKAKRASIWIETGPPQQTFPALDRDASTDVAVIGGGIVGITTALLLKEAGLRVVLLEAGRLGRGVSGHTTAKVSSQHGLIYARLRSTFGADAARVYGHANETALAWIAGRIEQDGIDCDFRRQPSYAYVRSESERSRAEDEAQAAIAAGLPASLVETTPLPYPVEAAVRFEDQAEFHVSKYLTALAERIPGEGCEVFEESRAVAVSGAGGGYLVKTPFAGVKADRVVVATHFPFLDRSLAFARMHPERSYAIACRIRGRPPEGMHISGDSPTRSVRAVPVDGGEELLLVGGEGHKTGTGGDTERRYRRLEEFANEHWEVSSVDYRWSSQDCVTADGLPFVGRLTPRSRRLLTATGFAKWGITGGTAAAAILADLLLEREETPAAKLLDPWRFTPCASAGSLIKENAHSGLRFVGDRLAKPGLRSIDDLGPDEGDIVRRDREKVAAYRDADGVLTAVSSRCTHLGCQVSWNSAERSWDCPCHGSRFAPDGSVLHGPAVDPLERK